VSVSEGGSPSDSGLLLCMRVRHEVATAEQQQQQQQQGRWGKTCGWGNAHHKRGTGGASCVAAAAVSGCAGPPKPWRFHKSNPRTEVVPFTHHVTYRNLWHNNGRW
jgi:hypothetical protein